MNKRLENCPVCNSKLQVTRYYCPECDITIEGSFGLSEFSSLSIEQQEFVKTFICCQGNIKEVEKELGISYPTVKNRLQQVSDILCSKETEKRSESNKTSSLDVLSALESGTISVEDAIKKIGKE